MTSTKTQRQGGRGNDDVGAARAAHAHREPLDDVDAGVVDDYCDDNSTTSAC